MNVQYCPWDIHKTQTSENNQVQYNCFLILIDVISNLIMTFSSTNCRTSSHFLLLFLGPHLTKLMLYFFIISL